MYIKLQFYGPTSRRITAKIHIFKLPTEDQPHESFFSVRLVIYASTRLGALTRLKAESTGRKISCILGFFFTLGAPYEKKKLLALERHGALRYTASDVGDLTTTSTFTQPFFCCRCDFRRAADCAVRRRKRQHSTPTAHPRTLPCIIKFCTRMTYRRQ